MKRHVFILPFFILMSCFLQAQENTGYINGLILDSLTNEKVLFANVFVPDDTIVYGQVSDINGFYTLELPEGEHQIMVTYIGYEDKIVSANIVADETLTKNIYIHVPILRRPEAGKAIDEIYGKWKVKCVRRDGKTFRPKREDKANERVGLYYSRFPDHEDGIGIFEYSNGASKIGEFYFRHQGDGLITMDHVFIQEITIAGGYRTRSKVYNNLNFGKLYENYSVTFKSEKKMIIENEMIKIVCVKSE